MAAFFANLGIAIAKFTGFAITRSSSMLAAGIHSVADTSNQALLLWGNRAAERPPTRQHPFGYGRERYFWSFVVALILFTLGSAFDLGALVGLFLALFGVGLTTLTDDAVWDGIATLAIGVLLGIIAIVLAIEMKSLLIGEGATPEDRGSIIKAIEGTDGVLHLIDMKTQHVGPEDLLVTAKLGFDHQLDGSEMAEVVDRAETAIRDVVPIAAMIYLEHDIFRPESQDHGSPNPDHQA